jgi:hypothetical protein
VPAIKSAGTSTQPTSKKTIAASESRRQFSLKINFKKVAQIQTRKTTILLTTFTTQNSTHSPQKHHVQHSLFPKNPCKNHTPPRQTFLRKTHTKTPT